MALHHLFERQAAAYADCVALCFGNKHYTYAQLNTSANQLARLLQANYAVSAGDRVLMFIPKSDVQVLILLALSKIGAIYVPLNPRDCPDERLDSIIFSTNPKCIFAQVMQEAINGVPIINLETSNARLQIFSGENLEIPVSENDIAYIIYTSGTTGIPKGVPIMHAGLSYWFEVMSTLFPLNDAYERKVLSFCLASFDASIWEYLMAWVNGSPLYIVDHVTRDDPMQLNAYIETHAITHATLIPSLLKHMMTSGLPVSLRVVCSTGEACTRDIVEIFENQGKQLFNCYGATEETFGLSVQECSLSLFDDIAGAPIGYPFGDKVKVHILNKEMVEVDNGQLYVESPYLTPGYWQQEEETQKNFVFHNEVKLYKTGDYFSRDVAKNILRYKGRINSEVLKIRGALVNLLEIESYLMEIPGVENVCVVVGRKGHYEFLVANLQVSSSADISSQALRNYLLAKLSSTAIPAQFIVTTDPLPLTSNSKKDRKKIQENYNTSQSLLAIASNFLPIERALIEIFERILRIDASDIRVSDTFFTLGGDSLSRLVLIAKIKEIFDVEISMHDLYSCDLTITALADLIHEYRWRRTPDVPVSPIIHVREKAQRIFMLHPITGEAAMTYYKLAKQWSEKNRGEMGLAIYGVNARGLNNPLDISSNLHHIANDYVRAIQHKQNQGPYIILGWSFGGVLAWKIAELLEKKKEIVKLVIIDTICPYVTQSCDSHSFEMMLHELIEVLRKRLGISCDLSQLPESLTTLSSEEKIKILFQYLIKNNSVQATQLQLIASFLLANQVYSPQKLLITPCLFTCEKTQDNVGALKLSTVIDRNFSVTLGWSLMKQKLLHVMHTAAATHFDFVENADAITDTVAELEQLLPSPPVSHESSANEALIALTQQVKWLTEAVTSGIHTSANNHSLSSSVFSLPNQSSLYTRAETPPSVPKTGSNSGSPERNKVGQG